MVLYFVSFPNLLFELNIMFLRLADFEVYVEMCSSVPKRLYTDAQKTHEKVFNLITN